MHPAGPGAGRRTAVFEAGLTRAVRAYLHPALDCLADVDLDASAMGSPGATARGTLLLAVEEAFHHRGQLISYLRAMGVTPPSIHWRP